MPAAERKRHRRAALAFLLMALLPAISRGLSSDRNQPIHIEADRATLDDERGISIYEGNVRLRQGTLRLSGNRMTVYLHDNNQVEKVVLTGNLAGYSQRFDGEDVDQQAEAGMIEYRAGSLQMILQERVRIWRKGSDEFNSDRIVINMKDNTLKAGSDSPDGRVHIILQPQAAQPDEETDSP